MNRGLHCHLQHPRMIRLQDMVVLAVIAGCFAPCLAARGASS